ncbi:MAG: hypothetical protein WCB01_01170 [Candidatus Cybelea sp.]|jgi:hypothetical protein
MMNSHAFRLATPLALRFSDLIGMQLQWLPPKDAADKLVSDRTEDRSLLTPRSSCEYATRFWPRSKTTIRQR